jgi:cyclophilin family peptidyl-prolyl cis-trans isomerase
MKRIRSGRFLIVAMALAVFGTESAVSQSSVKMTALDAGTGSALVAHLDLETKIVQTGQPVWVRLTLENRSDRPVTLGVPETEPSIPDPAMGLPLEHVFSGRDFAGVAIQTEGGQVWSKPIQYRRPESAPIITIAPNGMIGTRLDLTQYYPTLRSSGEYLLSWQPYGGLISSDVQRLIIAPRKQVVLTTDLGEMRLRLLYDESPHHVMNFLELVESGFYDGLTFHRLEPGYLLQGGCPRGDGTGIRPDGKRVAAEINAHPHKKGAVAMALLDGDPDSGSCQFYICNTRLKHLDGRYTIFAELVGEESFAALDRLMAVPVDEARRPVRTLYIRTARAMTVDSSELTP